MNTTSCAAIIIAAPASGQGKTSVTAALARFYSLQGKQVRVFKIGPDFLDPKILEQASGQPVYQLDLWMVGEEHSRYLLAQAAAKADMLLIEGVMGLFDGNPSTADFASKLGIPVLAVIDGSAMAQTFGALAHGLASYRDDIEVKGVIANRVASERHYNMIADSLSNGLSCYGSLPPQTEASLPSRHLGLVQAEEIADLQQRLTTLAEQLNFNPSAELPMVRFEQPPAHAISTLLDNVRIGVARDAAFSFIYQANIDLLEEMGAELRFFSPLTDKVIPDVDSLYLPGGYPELHLQALSNNQTMIDSIATHYAAEKPILAECGGMLYLTESLTDKHRETATMVGLMEGEAVMQKRLTALALQAIDTADGEIRGHSYHHSLYSCTLNVMTHAHCPNDSTHSEAVYQSKRLTASYIHFYFASNPTAISRFFTP